MSEQQPPEAGLAGSSRVPPPPPPRQSLRQRLKIPKWVVVLVSIFIALQLIGYGAVWVTEGPSNALALFLANISPFGTSTTVSQLPGLQGKQCSGKMKTEAVTSTRKFFWIFTYTFTETRSYCLNAGQSADGSI